MASFFRVTGALIRLAILPTRFHFHHPTFEHRLTPSQTLKAGSPKSKPTAPAASP